MKVSVNALFSSHAHKTGSWDLLGLLFKISESTHVLFILWKLFGVLSEVNYTDEMNGLVSRHLFEKVN